MKKQAVLYARVSTKDQEREGYSIPAQLKLLQQYAASHQFQLVQEFIDVETAKIKGRKQFGEMVRFFEKTPDCRTLLVEKTDRLYRNLHDCLKLEELETEIHLVKEGQIVSKNSRSQDKLVHGFHLLIARHYIENLKEEVKKGMYEKAAKGIYPSKALFGYRNQNRDIEIDPETGPIVQRLFELYATGNYSLADLRKEAFAGTGRKFAKSGIERILKNRFYIGFFLWGGKTYQGTHQPLVSAALFEQVQEVFRSHNRSKYRGHDFAFGGLLQCAYDNCMVTAELKKEKYTYYHCTGHRGKCPLPYFREEELGIRMGQILKDIHIPDSVLETLQEAFQQDRQRMDDCRKEEREKLQRKLTAVRNRMDQAYLDKLDGRITEDFWKRKSAEWQQEEQQVQLALNGLLEAASSDRLLTTRRILELANKAHSLYVRQKPVEQAKLLKIVLSNCALDRTSLYPTYRKPFELIFQAAKNENWLGR